MTVYEYMLQVWNQEKRVVRVSNPDGTVLLTDYSQPGYGGFGNLRAKPEFIIDGRDAIFTDELSSKAVRDRTFEFVN